MAGLTFTTKQIVLLQIICTVRTLRASPTHHIRLAHTLTTVRVTHSQTTHHTGQVTVTVLTALRIGQLQVPIQRPTYVTYTALYTLLTLTQLTGGHGTTTGKGSDYTGRVTVAIW